MEDFIFKIAETKEEKFAAYKVRFQCLTLEMGDTLYANYENKTFKDKLDEADKSKLFLAIDTKNNEVVATQRITFRKEIEFTADYLYDYSLVSRALGISPTQLKQRAVLHDRLSTLKPYRKHMPNLFVQLFKMCENNIREELTEGVMMSFINFENISALEILMNRFDFKKIEKEYTYNKKRFYQIFKQVK